MQEAPDSYCGIETVAIGFDVGVSLPPGGSSVTITVETPRMSPIDIAARPSPSGTNGAA